jgi:hypothetical protein
MSYIGSTPTNQNFIAGTDYFNGTGSAVNFTLSRSVNSVNDIEVLVNNVAQIPSGYLVSGTTLTFSIAPSAGTSNVYVRYLSTTNLSLAIPSGTSAAFNTVTATSVNTTNLTTTNGTIIQGLTVGRGAGAVATNTAVGASALAANTTGKDGVALGNLALRDNTSGIANIAIGSLAMITNTTGSYNTAIGNGEAGVTQGALGLNTTGSNNTGVGYQALRSNTTANYNTAVGYQAGLGVTTGSTNTFLGYQAATNVTTTANGVYIGSGVLASAATGVSAELIVATGGGTGKGSFTGFIFPGGGGVFQGNNSSTWSVTSDQRLKKNIVDNNTGLSAIAAIRVRNFEYRLPEEVTDLPQNQAVAKAGVQLGVIAQELQQVLPECVKTESTGVMSVDTDNLTWYLINAIKEQQAIITALTTRITALEAK